MSPEETPLHLLEQCHSYEEAIKTRRERLGVPEAVPSAFAYDAKELPGCCENVIGFVPIPIGVAGPLSVDGQQHWLPLATTEGALVASVNRGCKLLSRAEQGVRTVLRSDGMTRGPVLMCPGIEAAEKICTWTESEAGFRELKKAFDKTSSYARLQTVVPRMVGRRVYLRFCTETGEAMGMNMVGKGCEAALSVLCDRFDFVTITSLSGNYCSDKKAGSGVNWQLGRGKCVIAEAVLKKTDLESILKCSVEGLVDVYQSKCLIGSNLAGCGGAGSNAHAANIVTAVFAATGQDLAQAADSSSCMTVIEMVSDSLVYASVTMPCIHVGTIGGGTRLPPQAACIDFTIGRRTSDGTRAQRLARVLAAAVLAGELSLLGSLAEGSLMRAHLQMNRPPGRAPRQ